MNQNGVNEMKTIRYKDSRDETIVYAGVNKIGRIVRGKGGWAWQPESAKVVNDATPRYSSRQRAKEGIKFRKFKPGERESEEYMTNDFMERMSDEDKAKE